MGAAVVVVGLAFWLFQHLRHQQPVKQGGMNSRSSAFVSKNPVANPALARAADQTNQAASAARNAPEIVGELLRSQAGQVTGHQAWEALEQIKNQGTNALPAIRRLLAATNVAERLLGLVLALEIEGPSDALLSSALTDSSPFLAAQAAEWLFLNGRFPEWDRLMKEAVRVWGGAKIEQTFLLLDSKLPRPEMPAALSLLQLGRSLPRFLSELVSRDPAAPAAVGSGLMNGSASLARQEALVSILAEARPAGYAETLRLVIARGDAPESVRLGAMIGLCEGAPDAATARYLADFAATHPQDAIAARATQMAEGIERQTTSREAPLAVIEEGFRQSLMATNAVADRAPGAILALYIESLRRDRFAVPDRALLEAGRQLLSALPHRDYAMRQRLADIDYLLWRKP